MKKIILYTALAATICTPTFAQKKAAEDPTVMTIAGKDIPLSEFLYYEIGRASCRERV